MPTGTSRAKQTKSAPKKEQSAPKRQFVRFTLFFTQNGQFYDLIIEGDRAVLKSMIEAGVIECYSASLNMDNGDKEKWGPYPQLIPTGQVERVVIKQEGDITNG